MSRREDVSNAIWVDPDFSSLSADAKLFYLWSFTNPHCNMSGLYKISTATMSFETGLDVGRTSGSLTELQESDFLFYVDRVLWVRSRVKHLRSRSPQMAKSIANDLLAIRFDHPLRVRFVDFYRSDAWLRETLSEPYREPIVNLSEKPIGKGDSYTLSRPSVEGPGQGQGQGQGSSKENVQGRNARANELPDGFPDELLAHLPLVRSVLADLAARRGAKDVSVVSLASVMMARPRKPFVRAAHDCVAHWDAKATPPKDVVAAYRNWLDRTDDLAGVEQLPGAGGRVVAMPRSSVLEHADRWQHAAEYQRGEAS